MNKIIFDFDGTTVEVGSGIQILSLVNSGGTKIRFNDSDYVIAEKIITGVERSAEIFKERLELLTDNNYKGDIPDDDVMDLYVKLKKV